MKKKFFNGVSTLAIVAIVALNVHVVTSEQTPAFLKWDVIGKILADGTSGSGSGSGTLRWVFKLSDNNAICPGKSITGQKFTCQKVVAPDDVTGCVSGSTKYLGCD
ncbi:hypothetical protein [Geofilum rubicundum]|uniref:Secreted protein n=1 Tax=Geofilum rubicundum JCM 15548 TaxID=1236989 RepID=A0A0E9LY67_9BACT|nr:hypothetical protein [Geofilum rubicundum]GAO30507.1 hypothetical protein JCM15548_12783 [Geofilum rubicundum JCM 15548]